MTNEKKVKTERKMNLNTKANTRRKVNSIRKVNNENEVNTDSKMKTELFIRSCDEPDRQSDFMAAAPIETSPNCRGREQTAREGSKR